MTNTDTIVYLDESMRTPGVDHLDQYRGSCFYNLVNKSTKERGNAYEELCAKVLRKMGHDAKVFPLSHGEYDLIVDGEKVELKTSRKASQYDTRGRDYQFCYIRPGTSADYMILMCVRPDDTVELWKTSLDRILSDTTRTDKKSSSYNLALHPSKTDADLMYEVKVQ